MSDAADRPRDAAARTRARATWSIILARGLVDRPEEVEVEEIAEPDALVFELKVAEEDLGKVIGKQGRTAKALRTILSAASAKTRPPRHPRNPRVAAAASVGLRDRYDPETLPVGVLGPAPRRARRADRCGPHNATGRVARRGCAAPAGRATADDSRTTSRRCARVADGYLVRLAGIDDRDAAAALTLAEVRLPRAVLPPLAPGEFYVEDVVGCAVDRRGRDARSASSAGTFWNGAHDVATVDR